MSDQGSSSFPLADDFIHVTLDNKTSMSSLESSLSSSRTQFSQVVFHDLSEVYPTDGNITFTYSFQSGVVPQIGDRIALYKVGWLSVSEFITTMFTPGSDDKNNSSVSKINTMTFPVENLPKDEENMYQFCYITSGNVVAGSSIPFTFRKPLGNELVAVEDPNDSGLVVFRSGVTQLQEQLIKSKHEKEILDKALEGIKSELYLVKSELAEKTRKCDLHKSSIHDMTVVIYDLNTEKKELLAELDQRSTLDAQLKDLTKINQELEVEITKLKQLVDKYETDIKLKESSIADMKEQITSLENTVTSLNKALNSSEKTSKSNTEVLNSQLEQANKSLFDIRLNMEAMQKQFEDKLKNLDDQFVKDKEMYEKKMEDLNSNFEKEKLNFEAQRKSLRSQIEDRDSKCENQIKLLQNQLYESYKHIEKLSLSMSEKDEIMKTLEESASNKLKELTQKHNSVLAENVSLNKEIGVIKNKCITLEQLIKNKDKNISDLLSAPQDGADLSRRLFTMEDQNALLQVQLVSLDDKLHSSESENFTLREEIQELKDDKLRMADQLSKMNEEIRNLNKSQNRSEPQPGQSSNERKKSAFIDLAQIFQLPNLVQQGVSSFSANATCEEASNSHPSQSSNSNCTKCNELLEKIKTVLKDKIDIRSELIQTKHANEEYCKHLRDLNEEAAALKSRVAVLEIELRKAKEVDNTNQASMYNSISSSVASSHGFVGEQSESKYTTLESKQLEELYFKEKETKALLQRNVEALMLVDAKNYSTIQKLKIKNAELMAELNNVNEQLANVNAALKTPGTADSSVEDLTKALDAVYSEKTRLESQLIELRKELVGKVSLSSMQELRDENEQLKKQLVDKQITSLENTVAPLNKALNSSEKTSKSNTEVLNSQLEQESDKKVKEQCKYSGASTSQSGVSDHPAEPNNLDFESWYISPPLPKKESADAVVTICPVCSKCFLSDSNDMYKKHVSDHFD